MLDLVKILFPSEEIEDSVEADLKKHRELHKVPLLEYPRLTRSSLASLSQKVCKPIQSMAGAGEAGDISEYLARKFAGDPPSHSRQPPSSLLASQSLWLPGKPATDQRTESRGCDGDNELLCKEEVAPTHQEEFQYSGSSRAAPPEPPQALVTTEYELRSYLLIKDFVKILQSLTSALDARPADDR